MDLGLDGRTVIVTGATGGIGRHIARGFAAEGANVVLTYHHAQARAERLAEEIGERALVVRYEQADPDGARTLVEAVREWSGRIDVLVNNAVNWGVAAEGETEPDWLVPLRGNIEGALRLSQAVAPAMRERKWGRLVHISSSLAEDGAAGSEFYAAAKAALHGFSRSAAFSLGGDGDILSNVVMPGLTRTDTNTEITGSPGAEHYASLAPIGRLLAAVEVAGPVVYLGSTANTGITGQVIRVTGGS